MNRIHWVCSLPVNICVCNCDIHNTRRTSQQTWFKLQFWLTLNGMEWNVEFVVFIKHFWLVIIYIINNFIENYRVRFKFQQCQTNGIELHSYEMELSIQLKKRPIGPVFSIKINYNSIWIGITILMYACMWLSITADTAVLSMWIEYYVIR